MRRTDIDIKLCIVFWCVTNVLTLLFWGKWVFNPGFLISSNVGFLIIYLIFRYQNKAQNDTEGKTHTIEALTPTADNPQPSIVNRPVKSLDLRLLPESELFDLQKRELIIGDDTIFAGFRFGMSHNEFFTWVRRYNARFEEKIILGNAEGDVLKYRIEFKPRFYSNKLVQLTIRAYGNNITGLLLEKYKEKYGELDGEGWKTGNTYVYITPLDSPAPRYTEITYIDVLFSKALATAKERRQQKLEAEAQKRRELYRKKIEREKEDAAKFSDII